MNKNLVFIWLLLVTSNVFGQFQNITGSAQKNNSTGQFRWNFGTNGVLIPASQSDVLFNGNRTITLNVAGISGSTPGGNDVQTFLNNLFYPTQAPTALLNGGSQQELASSGLVGPFTLSWQAGRLPSTENLQTVAIIGSTGQNFPLGFSQPSAPGFVSGTQDLYINANTNVNYTLTVTTIDGKTATSNTSINFYPKKYWGRTTEAEATSIDLLTALGGGEVLTTSKSGTATIIASGSNRVFYAYPSNFGDLTSINIGGLESITSFTKTVKSFTNASGYTQYYNVYTSNNETGGDVSAIIQ